MGLSYELEMNTHTYFGNKCVENAIKKEKSVIGDRCLIVTTGNSLKSLGYLDELIGFVDSEVYVYDKIKPNPDVIEIREAIAIGKEHHVTSVVGFGGGSAMDAAKAVAVGVVSQVDIEDYLLKGLTPPENTLPIIAIPTTSGTGSELSRGAIISSREKRIKTGIRGDRVVPTVAIVDPTYTLSMPFNVTMESGFDVLAHAIESYCSINANIFSEMISEKAIKIVGEALPRLSKNLDDVRAREMMSFASHIVGYNLKNVGNCLPHRLQYPIGVVTGTSHGAGLIALYPAWLKHEQEVNINRVRRCMDWIGCDGGVNAGECITKWLSDLGIVRTITELGNTMSAEQLAQMVTGSLYNDKLANIENIVEVLYNESM